MQGSPVLLPEPVHPTCRIIPELLFSGLEPLIPLSWELGRAAFPPAPADRVNPSPHGVRVFAQAEMILCFLLSLLNCPVGESLSALHFVVQNWC